MLNEEKKYSIIGKVEIGTDEYRDLIEAVKDSERKYNDEWHERYKQQSRANDLEQKLKALQEQFDELNEFVNSSEELIAKFKLFKFEKYNNSDK